MTSTAARRPRRAPRALLLGLGAFVLGTVVGLLAGLGGPTLGPASTGDAALAADVRAAFTTGRGFESLSAVRVRDGQVRFAGLGDAGSGPPRPDTPYELGSITKTFTAALLADALERGEVGLDDPVSAHLPELAGTDVGASTLRQLATHTAGLPPFPSSATPGVALRGIGNANPYPGSVPDLLAASRSTTVSDRGRYRYSNLGVALLGHALARAARAPDWSTLLRQRVLDPLHMDATLVLDRTDAAPAGTARPHRENGWRSPSWSGAAFAPAGSSTVTTAADLATWARALLDGTAPGARALDPVADVPGGRIGLVWQLRDVDGRSITWHNGATGGSRSILALDRERGQAVVLLSNSARDADTAGLRLAAAAPGHPVTGVDAPAVAWFPLASWNLAALYLLATAVLRWRRGRGWPWVDGVLAAGTGLLLLLVHGPWQLVPTALAVGVAAALLVGGVAAPARPARPVPRSTTIASLATSAVLLVLAVWSL